MKGLAESSKAVGIGLLCALMALQVAGCGKKPKGADSSSATPSSYVAKAREKTTVSLDRAGKVKEVPVPPELTLEIGDTVENKGKKPARITDTRQGHSFTLAPTAKIKIGDQSLTLIQGSGKFEFRKVDGGFRIVLPTAKLDIRGTSFLVLVKPDQQTIIQMSEGKTEIDQNGVLTPLAAPATAIIASDSTPVQVFATPSTLPSGVVKDVETVNFSLEAELGSDTDDVSRTRTSGF